MKNKFLIFLAIGIFTAGAAFFAGKTLAQNEGLANVQYPVKELNNCKSEADCKAFCNKPANLEKCMSFAKENNLMSQDEINNAKKFVAADDAPGGCTTKDSCEEYCNNMSHIDECIAFAEKNNLMSGQELAEAKKVQAAMAKGIKPPACGNKKSCDSYCEDPNHMEECITFATEAGFMQGKELEDAQKMLQAIKRGVKPPPCKGKDACDQYCSNPDNMEVCMNFAAESGMMSEEEKANSQKMIQALKKGIKPPPCKGKDECDAYCGSEEHFQECINFSVAAGMMSEKDAEMAKKTGGKGPGGCKGKDECDAFCKNPDNQQTCFDFGKANGLISEEDLKRMEEGAQRTKQFLLQASSEVINCLNSELGPDMVERMKNGFMPPQDASGKMQKCFEKMGPPEPGTPGEGGMVPPAGQPGPGGCKTPEECQSYCESHQEECKNFYPAGDESRRGSEPSQQQGQMMQGNQTPPEPQCKGENCQGPPREIQPGQNLNEGRELNPVPEDQMPPGDYRPPVEMAPQDQQPPANEPPPPPPPPPAESAPPSPVSYIINTDSLVGSLIDAAFKALVPSIVK